MESTCTNNIVQCVPPMNRSLSAPPYTVTAKETIISVVMHPRATPPPPLRPTRDLVHVSLEVILPREAFLADTALVLAVHPLSTGVVGLNVASHVTLLGSPHKTWGLLIVMLRAENRPLVPSQVLVHVPWDVLLVQARHPIFHPRTLILARRQAHRLVCDHGFELLVFLFVLGPGPFGSCGVLTES